MTKEYQEVEVYVMVSGDYCAFSEMSFNIVYDVTNEIAFDDYTLEDLEGWDRGHDDYSDVDLVKAIKIGDKYYLNL